LETGLGRAVAGRTHFGRFGCGATNFRPRTTGISGPKRLCSGPKRLCSGPAQPDLHNISCILHRNGRGRGRSGRFCCLGRTGFRWDYKTKWRFWGRRFSVCFPELFYGLWRCSSSWEYCATGQCKRRASEGSEIGVSGLDCWNKKYFRILSPGFWMGGGTVVWNRRSGT
jgi:hypothetical protein